MAAIIPNRLLQYSVHEFLNWLDQQDMHSPWYLDGQEEYCYAGFCNALYVFFLNKFALEIQEEKEEKNCYGAYHHHGYAEALPGTLILDLSVILDLIATDHIHTLLLELYPGAYNVPPGEHYINRYYRLHNMSYNLPDSLNCNDENHNEIKHKLRVMMRDKLRARPDRIMSFMY